MVAANEGICSNGVKKYPFVMKRYQLIGKTDVQVSKKEHIF